MHSEMFNNLLELLLQFFIWSSILFVIAYSSSRVFVNVRYWSALWKTTLLLCFLPFMPWSYFELSYVSQPLLDIPHDWMSRLTSIDSEALSQVNVAAVESNNGLLVLTLILIMTISIFKTMGYFFKIQIFIGKIRTYHRLSCDAPKMKALTEQQRRYINNSKIEILISPESTSPYVTGVFRPKLVLPNSFFELATTQQILLLEHELTHIKRQDVAWLNMSQVISNLFWFAPATHLIMSQLEVAIEIECDAEVLAIYPSLKKEYAGALLNIVKLTQHKIQPQTAFFINKQFSALKSRIQLTQQKTKQQGPNVMNKITLGISAVLLSAASWVLQANAGQLMNVEEFLSLHKNATQHIDEESPATKPKGTWINPVKKARVSSKFKAKQKIRGFKAHLGIDLVAKKGQPIVAASGGIVVIASDTSLHKNYGKVVVIDHGENTLSMYLHMDSIAVNKGDRISLGQLLGKVGETGQATGPHLHFEVIAAGRHIDPASIIQFNSSL